MILLLSLIEVYFSPNGGARDAILKEIENAEYTIDVCVYLLTDRILSKALVDAVKRGIKVRVVLDGEGAIGKKYSHFEYLIRHGVPVRLYIEHLKEKKRMGYTSLMHHKFALIDRKVLITGSYNWTATAEEKNNENLLIIKEEKGVIGKYIEEFEKLWRRSVDKRKRTLNARNIRELKRHINEWWWVKGRIRDIRETKKGTIIYFDGGFKAYIRGHLPDKRDFYGEVVTIFGKIQDHPKYGFELYTQWVNALKKERR